MRTGSPGRSAARRPAGSSFASVACRRAIGQAKSASRATRGATYLTGPDLLRGRQLPAGWPLDRDPFYLETSVPGVFAAGDVRHGSVKRVASAVGEGAMAVAFVHRYLANG